MRTRSEIEHIVTSAYVGSERQSKVADALLEVMMDIREALLDPVGATNAYKSATEDYAEALSKLAEMKKELEEAKSVQTGHPGWTCDDAHPGLSHESWTRGDYGQEPPDGLDLGGAADQVAESRAETSQPADPYEAMEGNEVDQNAI